jgi:hypothetical protein
LRAWLDANGHLVAVIPSRKGLHFITRPHKAFENSQSINSIEIHKDNPTNLYIPEGAA